ncbi:MAG: hypothetical protein ACXW3F_17085, partial [Pyrinomonadaceae bacterium]
MLQLHVFAADEVFRGFGASAGDVKSALLLPVSWQPPNFRCADVVLLGAAALSAVVAPSRQIALVPYPTKSIIVAPVGHVALLSAPVPLTSATLPAVAAMSVNVPGIRSGVGNGLPVPLAL